MSAYAIITREHTRNPDELKQYGEAAKAARAGHEITALAFYGETVTLEGASAESAVILEFPDMAAARAWYESPAYQAAKQHRHLGADYRVILVDGVKPA